jgi:ribosomal protein S18 acetylase RimI-like enzyme
MSSRIVLRPIRSEDEAFLYEVYAGTRQEELAPLGWSEAEKEAFLRMQFSAQHRFYHEQYAAAEFQVILCDERPVGRLYVDRREDEIRIVDIALLPEARNAGIGSSLLKNLLAEASRAGKAVRIHVERFNPALRLYQRLGFARVADKGVHYLMEWLPENAAASKSGGGRDAEVGGCGDGGAEPAGVARGGVDPSSGERR